MPRIVAYSDCLAAMRQLDLRCLYYNSGAFGFERGVETHSVGWICEDDPSLRPEARSLTRQISKPAGPELSRLLAKAATELLPGPVWVMPKSHWAFELDFGGKAWMAAALRELTIDPALLQPLTTGDPIEFSPGEIPHLARFAEQLLTNLAGSDFAVAFPGKPVVCTLHHHKQIWWTTTDLGLLENLRQLAASSPV